MVDIEKLNALAEAANAVIGDVRIHADMESQMGSKEEAEAVMGFMVAANPAAVLELIAENERFKAERDQLRAEVEALRKDAERYRQAMVEVMRQVDGNIRETVRDCVNGGHDVQDIYDYCDLIEEAIGAAMAAKEGE